jgi:PRC-barrel domain protein
MSVAYTVFQGVRKLEKGTHIAEHERRSYAMTQRTGAEIGFGKFSNSNFMFENPAQDIRGKDVYDARGEQVGSVDDLYVDGRERKVRFLETPPSKGRPPIGAPSHRQGAPRCLLLWAGRGWLRSDLQRTARALRLRAPPLWWAGSPFQAKHRPSGLWICR